MSDTHLPPPAGLQSPALWGTEEHVRELLGDRITDTAARKQTLAELEASLTDQQALMTQNLQELSDQSIDLMFKKARSLMLLTVGTVLLAFIVYRNTGRSRAKSKFA